MYVAFIFDALASHSGGSKLATRRKALEWKVIENMSNSIPETSPPPSTVGASTKTPTPSESTNLAARYSYVVSNLRSITMHPLAFLLTEYLHRQSEHKQRSISVPAADGQQRPQLPIALQDYMVPEADEKADNNLMEKFTNIVTEWAKLRESSPKINGAANAKGSEVTTHGTSANKAVKLTERPTGTANPIGTMSDTWEIDKHDRSAGHIPASDPTEESEVGDRVWEERSEESSVVKKRRSQRNRDDTLTKDLMTKMSPILNADRHKKHLVWEESFCTENRMVFETGASQVSSKKSHKESTDTQDSAVPDHEGSACTRHNESTETVKNSPAVLLVELGLASVDWWKKAHQGFKYVKSLSKDGLLQKLMLVTIWTLDAPPPDSGKGNRVVEGGRFGVFLVMPKKEPETFRAALLWRHACVSLEDVAFHFVRILRATEFLVNWKTPEDLDYEYLGPHCCRIGKEVRDLDVVGVLAVCWKVYS
jgi:hypothetical protein